MMAAVAAAAAMWQQQMKQHYATGLICRAPEMADNIDIDVARPAARPRASFSSTY
jgi:hypothetical protein